MTTKRVFWSVLAGLASLVLLASLSFLLGRHHFGLKPPGDLLSPSYGLWRHHPTGFEDAKKSLEQAIHETGLPPVDLTFDSSGVPHLKSENETSLYFAQGYITAYFRLWQMDFLSRITAGRVAEILGEKAVPMDRFFRRMRLPAAAHASAEMMMLDPVTRGPLADYARGVNARIAQMDVTSVPIEYRVFGILPEPWTPERGAYLLKFMTWQLTGYNYEFGMTAAKAKLSPELFEMLFPFHSKIPGTILGDEREIKSRAARSLKTPDERMWSLALQKWNEIPDDVKPEPANGSNNWAMPAKMMSTKRALLANDLHLSYSLPTLWFPIQLSSPAMNVYGASLPGSPGVIVGFNDTMGWAVTNGTDDVLDWYSLRFRDEKHQEYMFEDSWRPIVTREEVISIAGGKSEIIRTRETHIGPIVFDEGDEPGSTEVPAGLVVQWTGYTPSNELKNFLLLNRAQTARDCLTALHGYVAPAQNFVCADREGRLVYKHAGLFPDRNGRDGRFVFEASNREDLWRGMLPSDQNPVLETASEPIVTANQAPFNGENLHRFGWFFAAPYRALQIRERMEAKKTWKPEEVVELQGDTTGWLARNFKRIILREGANQPLKQSLDRQICGSQKNESLRQALETWSGDHAAENRIAPLVRQWLETLESSTWNRVVGNEDSFEWPSSWRFYELLDKEPHSALWDDPSTTLTENLNSRLEESLEHTCAALKEKFGSTLPTWGEFRPTSIRHATRVSGFGRSMAARGASDAIFSNKGAHGPTWKMVVSFEDKPKAWMMIPGGISGDPSSPLYDDLISDWSKGAMRAVDFHRTTEDALIAKSKNARGKVSRGHP